MQYKLCLFWASSSTPLFCLVANMRCMKRSYIHREGFVTTSLPAMLPTLFILLVFLLATHATSHRRPRHRLVRRDTPGWAYVDCVNDGPARALTGYLISDKANTIDKCIATCADRGFVYAGLQCECGPYFADLRWLTVLGRFRGDLAHVVR